MNNLEHPVTEPNNEKNKRVGVNSKRIVRVTQKTIFNNKALFKKHTELATTAQLIAVVEYLTPYLEVRLVDDERTEKLENEKIQQAQEIIKLAQESGISKAFLKEILEQ